MADNPIKYKDFISPDGSITNLISQLERLETTYTEMFKKIKDEAVKVEESIKKVNGATKGGQKATKEAAIKADQLTKAQEKLKKSQSNTGVELTKLKGIQRKQNNLTKLEIKLNKSKEGSYDKLSAQYSLNKLKLNAMSAAQREGSKSGQKLEKETNNIYEEMKRLQEATGKHTLSVGDYEKGWKGVSNQLTEMPGAAGGAAQGLKGLGQSAKALLANPILLMIAGVVAGLTALYQLFKRTKSGSDLLARGGAILSGILSELVGVVDFLAKALIAAFNDPQKALKAFWEALKKNIINRFAGLIDLIGAVGSAFKALWERDMEGLKGAAKEAGTALVKMGTGLDAEQQREFAEAIQATTKSIYDQISAFDLLEQAKKNTKRQNREIEKQLQDLITEEELLKATADNGTKSFKERENAAKAASALTIKRAKLQRRVAQSELSLINQEIDLRKSNGEQLGTLLDKQLEYYKVLKEAERDFLLVSQDNQKRQSQLRQDRLEKDLDILIDGFDNQKTINEKIIADDTRTFQEREKVLNDTKSLFEDSFAKQIETIQKFIKR